jgi:LPS export ABC transporter protein LptC
MIARFVLRNTIFVGLLGLALAGCGQKRPATPAASQGELPDQEVSDFVITETQAGAVEWKLYAKKASTYDAKDLVIADHIRIDFFDEKGVKSSELVARTGEINQRTRNMTARGDVVLQTTEGTRLSSQELRFLNKEQLMVVPESQLVRVERGSDVLTGYGFQSDPQLKNFEFKRSVEATVRSKAAETETGR